MVERIGATMASFEDQGRASFACVELIRRIANE